MRSIGTGMIALVVVSSTALGADAERPELCPAKRWVDQRGAIERFLESAAVLSLEPIGEGVTKPWRARLSQGGQAHDAAFKPLPSMGKLGGDWESYRAEVAAYRFDRYLGLDMVPPTITRRIKGNMGSLQYWVDGCRQWKRLHGEKVTGNRALWNMQLARMKAFDALVLNTDRNGGNILVDEDWHMVLIDHSRAFVARKKLTEDLPSSFDRDMVAMMRAMTRDNMRLWFDGVLQGGEVDALLARRDKLIEHLDEMVRKHGEARVLFGAPGA